MKKFLKVTLVLVLLIAVVIAIASIALHILLPPEKAKAMVLKQMASHLHREVSMGAVSVGIFSGVSVSDLKVSEAPNFDKGTFLSTEQFSLNVSLTPLLFRKVVAQVSLRHPEVSLVRFSDGKTFNFSDLTAPPTAASPTSPNPTLQAPANEKPPFQLLVSRAEISNGVLHLVDRSPAQQSVEISPLNLKLKNVSLTAMFGVQAALVARARGHEASFDLSGQANVLSGDFVLKNCVLASGGSSLRASGKASQLRTGHPAGDFKIDLDPFEPSAWKPWLILPPEIRWFGPMAAHVHIKGDEKKAVVSAQADLTRVQLAYAKSFSKPAKVPLVLAVSATLSKLQNLEIDSAQLALGGLKLAAHGSVEAVRSPDPSVNLHFETNSLPMAEVARYAGSSLPSDIALAGSSRATADVSGTTASARLDAKWDASELSITRGNTFAKPVGTPFKISLIGELLRPPAKGAVVQDLNFQTLAGVLGPIEWSGNGSFKTVGSKSDLALTVKTNLWSAAEAARLSPLASSYRLSGHVAAEARVSGSSAAPQVVGSIVLNEMGAHYEASEVSNTAGTITFTQQDVTAPKIVGKLNGSEFSVQFAGHHLQTQPELRLDASIAELDLNKLLPPSASATPPKAALLSIPLADAAGVGVTAGPGAPMKLAGHVTVGKVKHEFYQGQSLDMKWNLGDVTPELTHVAGTATLRQGPGHLLNVQKLASQSRAARLALLPILTLQKIDTAGLLKSLGVPSLQDIPFETIKGDYVFQNGVMNVKDFDLNGQDLTIQTQGTIGLAGVQPLNLGIQMKLAAGAIGGTVGQILQDENGRVTIHLTATGTANDPKVRADLGQAGQRVQQIGRDLLKSLGGGGSSTPPPNGTAAPARDSKQQNPVDDLQKTLKNIFH